MKKKILALMLVVSMLAVAVLSGTLAYFTDTDEAENVFTVGNVDIEIEEPNWKPDNSDKLENIVPGVSYDKDPQVKNVGSNPAYVRMTVCFQNGVNIGGLSSVEPESLTDMLKNISSNWTLVDEGLDMGVHFDGAHDNCWYVTFTYNEILEPGETTDPLFTAVQFPSSWDQNTFKNFIGDSFEIDVMAEAIQAEGFNSSAEAFAGLSGSTITTVSTTDELAAALDAGESVIGISGTEVELNYEVNNGVLETGAKLIGVTEDATLTFTGLGTGSVSVSLENLTVVDETCYESENGENAWEFTYLELTGKNTFRNVVFTDGIMIDGNADITCIDCTFIGHNNDSSTLSDVKMNGVWVLSGNATFRNCTFEGTRGIKVCDSNTSSTYASADVNVVVDNCTFDSLSEKPGVAIDYSGDTTIGFSVTIKNSTFIDCQPGDQNLYIYETDNYTPVLENNTVVSGTSVIVS